MNHYLSLLIPGIPPNSVPAARNTRPRKLQRKARANMEHCRKTTRLVEGKVSRVNNRPSAKPQHHNGSYNGMCRAAQHMHRPWRGTTRRVDGLH